MKITRISIMSGIMRTRDVPVTREQIARWTAGEPIQRVMPDLTPDDREFILTGVVPDEWSSMGDKDE